MTTETEIDAFELLKEEMTTDEIHLRVNAIHRMKTVILSIGNASTVNDLIPYLESKSNCSDLTI
jgi:hypothetical protein